MPQITTDIIATKEFAVKPRGYDQEQVDKFLDDICDEMDNQQNLIKSLQQQLREAQAASARPVPAPALEPRSQEAALNSSENSLREILQMAQKVKDETIADARKKAEEILSDARTQAEKQLGSIAQERDSLSHQLEELRTTVTDYRTRFESLLSEQKQALEKIADL